MPESVSASTGAMAIGGRANRAMLTPRASFSDRGEPRTNTRRNGKDAAGQEAQRRLTAPSPLRAADNRRGRPRTSTTISLGAGRAPQATRSSRPTSSHKPPGPGDRGPSAPRPPSGALFAMQHRCDPVVERVELRARRKVPPVAVAARRLNDLGDPTRPARITTTRSARNTASSMPWVTSSVVAPLSRQIRCSSRFICRRRIWSSAPNGSSRNRMPGR